GWHIPHAHIYRGWWLFPTSALLHASRTSVLNGWAKSPAVEAEIAAWFDANAFEEERSAARRLNEAALNEVVCAPLGWYLHFFALTKDLSGVTQGPLPFFWGVSKTA